MTALYFSVVLLAVAQLGLPRKWAFTPLIIAGLHLGNMEVLPELTPARILLLVGLGRAVLGGYFRSNTRSPIDILLLTFALVTLASSFGHTPDHWSPSPFAVRLGLVLNAVGTYLYGRAYLCDPIAFLNYSKLIPIVLVPLAVGMSIEKRTGRNLYHPLGAPSAESLTRDGRVRSQGPFRHPILAGTAGATLLPFVFLLWIQRRRRAAIVGMISSGAVILASGSSGPLAAVALTLAALFFWYKRSLFIPALWMLVLLVAFYSAVSGRGPWYLMARIDLVGGSTGWHRAYLIDQSLKYLNEWWLLGTDFTRHWMPTGVSWSPNHSDITNYYIHLGVTGGLGLTGCLGVILVMSFKQLRHAAKRLRESASPEGLLIWCAASSLATHAVSFISISYFDQMFIYFYVLLGAIPGLVTMAICERLDSSTAERHATCTVSE